jgi:hypothetical protein
MAMRVSVKPSASLRKNVTLNKVLHELILDIVSAFIDDNHVLCPFLDKSLIEKVSKLVIE